MTRLLEIEHINAFYGYAQALFDVSLQVDEGEVVALLGRNGMGKTTTIRTLCRLLPYRQGNIQFAGQDMAPLPPYKAANLGLGLVPEGRRCFFNLTVYENLIAAARKGEWDFQRVTQLFPRLLERREQLAATLSGGEQQMLAIGRALMTNPRLLILDEATEGLAPVIRQEIWAALHQLKQQDLSILVVDKNLAELLPVAERCVIVEKGATVWEGAPNALDETVKARYLGV